MARPAIVSDGAHPATWWEVHWRGTITRDVGWDIISATTADEAKKIYERDYTTRSVTKVLEAI